MLKRDKYIIRVSLCKISTLLNYSCVVVPLGDFVVISSVVVASDIKVDSKTTTTKSTTTTK